MSISEQFIPEFDQEMATTRRVLERVPADKFDWRPHPKSGTFVWLAGHVANLPMWAKMTMDSASFDLAPPGGQPAAPPPAPKTTEELLSGFDANVKAAREALLAASDQDMMKPWSLLNGGQTIFTMPKVAVFRSVVLNHLIHHRGQLSVYLRLNDIPVPAMYGPSADEGSF